MALCKDCCSSYMDSIFSFRNSLETCHYSKQDSLITPYPQSRSLFLRSLTILNNISISFCSHFFSVSLDSSSEAMFNPNKSIRIIASTQTPRKTPSSAKQIVRMVARKMALRIERLIGLLAVKEQGFCLAQTNSEHITLPRR